METERVRYIYCIINKVNGKTYFGQRTLANGRTFETDTYRGSGKILHQAYEKYGKENFERTCIVQGHFSKEQINRFERCVIFFARLNGKAEYNLADGGDGGDLSKFIDYSKIEYNRELRSKNAKNQSSHFGGKHNNFLGHHHTDEFKKRQSERMRGNLVGYKNGSFGKSWWTNGKESVKAEVCPDGFWKGRVVKPKRIGLDSSSN